ncbi:unnamed protein product [Penicillium camemberti]|uniref:Str. FM013 n=1 Tax=Penicillium camemberti (strain FM 013) TaxID=1429867 RepID=A0A0G4P6E0_PENC3|nr:unnamed protein product [Penicillium camemberti]
MVEMKQSIGIPSTTRTTYSTSATLNRFGTLAYYDLTVSTGNSM